MTNILTFSQWLDRPHTKIGEWSTGPQDPDWRLFHESGRIRVDLMQNRYGIHCRFTMLQDGIAHFVFLTTPLRQLAYDELEAGPGEVSGSLSATLDMIGNFATQMGWDFWRNRLDPADDRKGQAA